MIKTQKCKSKRKNVDRKCKLKYNELKLKIYTKTTKGVNPYIANAKLVI